MTLKIKMAKMTKTTKNQKTKDKTKTVTWLDFQAGTLHEIKVESRDFKLVKRKSSCKRNVSISPLMGLIWNSLPSWCCYNTVPIRCGKLVPTTTTQERKSVCVCVQVSSVHSIHTMRKWQLWSSPVLKSLQKLTKQDFCAPFSPLTPYPHRERFLFHKFCSENNRFQPDPGQNGYYGTYYDCTVFIPIDIFIWFTVTDTIAAAERRRE